MEETINRASKKNNIQTFQKNSRNSRNINKNNKNSQTLIDLKDIITNLNLRKTPKKQSVESKIFKEKYQSFLKDNIINFSNLINSERNILSN